MDAYNTSPTDFVWSRVAVIQAIGYLSLLFLCALACNIPNRVLRIFLHDPVARNCRRVWGEGGVPRRRVRKVIVVTCSGRAGAGKDTAADLLVRHHGFIKMAFADALRNVGLALVRTVFGYKNATLDWFTHRALKEEPLWCIDRVVQNAPDLLQQQFTTVRTVREAVQAVKRTNPSVEQSAGRIGLMTPRKLLQLLGTDIMRTHLGRSVWVDTVVNKIVEATHAGSPIRPLKVVISDCRFPNELALTRGGSRLRQQIPQAQCISLRLRNPHAREDARAVHVSETALDDAVFDTDICNDQRYGEARLRQELENMMRAQNAAWALVDEA